MAGASCDDIFVIVLFSTFVGMAQGGDANWMDFAGIPVSIVLGIALGAAAGFALSQFFETAYAHKRRVRNSVKVIVVLGISFLLMAMETWLEGVLSLSGLLAVVSMACVLKMKSAAFVSKRLSEKFGKLWLAAELILFVLVGAAVDIRYTLHAGIASLLMIFIALAFRSMGVALCLVKTPLTGRERLFCMIAYLPKATVQAAIGSVPLAIGLPCGPIVLSVAVLAILLTAPLGALGMDLTYRRLLKGRQAPEGGASSGPLWSRQCGSMLQRAGGDWRAMHPAKARRLSAPSRAPRLRFFLTFILEQELPLGSRKFNAAKRAGPPKAPRLARLRPVSLFQCARHRTYSISWPQCGHLAAPHRMQRSPPSRRGKLGMERYAVAARTFSSIS